MSEESKAPTVDRERISGLPNTLANPILDYNLDYNSGQPLPSGVVDRLHRRSSERSSPSDAVQKYGRYLIISAKVSDRGLAV
jgi:hypothetical protein